MRETMMRRQEMKKMKRKTSIVQHVQELAKNSQYRVNCETQFLRNKNENYYLFQYFLGFIYNIFYPDN